MKTISLPRSPFFCACDGRYLPSLTDLIVGATAMVQRHEIEQQLFTLRLKQRCFVALAEQAPAAIFQQVEPTPPVQTPAPRRATLKLFPGAVDCPLQTQPGSTAGTPPSVSLHHENERNNNQGTERAGVFNPMSQYTKGRYNP